MRRSFVALLALIGALACQSSLSPRDNVDGTWVQRGTDTYAKLALVQQRTAVYGTFSLCAAPAMGGCTTDYEVTGTVVFPLVVLRWNNTTFDGIVTADTLAVRISSNGQPSGPTSVFHRTAGP